jgi:hypothetical protein
VLQPARRDHAPPRVKSGWSLRFGTFLTNLKLY